ncbi:MAG: hypothetical protein QM765_51740 [Myxococcales bacterium]
MTKFSFSEIEESAELLLDLVRSTGAAGAERAATFPPPLRPAPASSAPARTPAPEIQSRPAARPPPPPPVPAAVPIPPTPTAATASARPVPLAAEPTPAPRYRSEKLEQALAAMCRRGGFAGALLADAGGLPVAEHKSPMDSSLVAAFTTVLAAAAEKAGALLNHHHQANHISLDIDYTSKAELRRFQAQEAPYHLVAICSQTCDARAEMEVTIPTLCSILSA